MNDIDNLLTELRLSLELFHELTLARNWLADERNKVSLCHIEIDKLREVAKSFIKGKALNPIDLINKQAREFGVVISEKDQDLANAKMKIDALETFIENLGGVITYAQPGKITITGINIKVKKSVPKKKAVKKGINDATTQRRAKVQKVDKLKKKYVRKVKPEKAPEKVPEKKAKRKYTRKVKK